MEQENDRKIQSRTKKTVAYKEVQSKKFFFNKIA